MYRLLILFLSLLILISCNTNQENKTTEKEIVSDTLNPIQKTAKAKARMSLPPVIITSDTVPKPLTVVVPIRAGGFYYKTNSKGEVRKINLEPPINIVLPVLHNEKGQTILDPEGNPFMMGDGGKSNFTNFTSDNGLALDGIICSVMDKKGNLWFGTDGGGVSRYDGKSFTNFTSAQGLANNSVLSIKEDKSGQLWFGTLGGGVSKYDGKSFTTYTTVQGLANNTVRSIAEDKNGNLWFGTDGGGVSRYDPSEESIQTKDGIRASSKSFTSFTTAQGLANNIVRSIAIDKSGNIWFGTDGGGVSRYNPTSGSNSIKEGIRKASVTFTNFTTSQGLANNTVRSVIQDKSGNMWFGTDGGGVSRYDPKLTNNACNSLTCKHDLKVRKDLESHNNELAKSFTSYTTAQGLAQNSVSTITEDKSGNIWFGTYGAGVSCYDPKAESVMSNEGFRTASKLFTSYTTTQGLANNTVYSITEDRSGNLWFGTIGNGVSRYDGKSFTNFTTSQGLANNTVYGIIEDKTGNLWFGTQGGGVSCYDGNSEVHSVTNKKEASRSFTNYTSAQGLANNSVLSIAEDKSGNIWFGTFGGGVSRYSASNSPVKGTKSFTSFTTAQGLAHNSVLIITEDKSGNLWFGTEGGGVSRYDGNRVEAIERGEKIPLKDQKDLRKDKNGHLVKSFTNYTTVQGLAHNFVSSITEDKSGNLWFGTYGGGVSCYFPTVSADTGSIYFNTFTTSGGLAHNYVSCITEDKSGNLWFGTDGGGVSRLSRINIEKLLQQQVLSREEKVKGKGTYYFDNFTSSQGLSNDIVYDIVEDKQGNIIIGTNLGFTVIPFKASKRSFSEVKAALEYYNHPNGYPIKDVNTNAMFCDSKGIIWAGTGSEKTALVRFDYAALQKNKQAPTLVIQNIKVNEENICWFNLQSKGKNKNRKDSAMAVLQEFLAYGKNLSPSENKSILKRFGTIAFDGITKFYPLPENLVLPFRHNHISFEFAAIETSKPNLVKYQYLLEGYENNWSPLSGRTDASFGNIYEGNYVFKLKALGANGVWCEPVIYKFCVLPPWYRTWWAYLIYTLSFLLALRIFSKWRERNLRRDKEKLERNVEERTDELVHKNLVVEKEKQRSDELLLNILPEEVAEELKAKGSAEAKQFDEVTVLFTDFKDFTRLSEKMSAKELVEEINTCFMAFDHIVEKHDIEKIKTIGDSYMCAGGLPVANKTHAYDVVTAALEIQQYILNRIAERIALGKEPFQIRIGIHTGPVVAGIVGIKKFAYDIWGNTVNTASRMESSGEVGQVNISKTTYELVKDKFNCIYRGKIEAKGKGEMDMYFVEGRI